MTGANVIPAVVLAGGRSRRMGADKATLMLRDHTLLERAVLRLSRQTTAVAVNTVTLPDRLPGDTVMVPDPIAGYRGPLAGILGAMRHAQSFEQGPARVATVAVDSPFFPVDLLERLAASVPDETVIAIAACNGRDHPVFGLWPVDLADDLELWVTTSADLSVRSFLRHHAFVEVDFEPLTLSDESLDPFFNVNAPEDFEQAMRIEERFKP